MRNICFVFLILFFTLSDVSVGASNKETIKTIVIKSNDDFTRSLLQPFSICIDASSLKIALLFHWNIGKLAVKIVDCHERLCFTENVTTDFPNFTIELSSLEQGEYLLEIHDQNNYCWRWIICVLYNCE